MKSTRRGGTGRTDRINEEIRKEMSQIFSDLKDPRIMIVSGWSARKLAALPGTGMNAEQAKALEEELLAANLQA